MGILQRTKVLSNTKRKIRRRRVNLEKHWDLIATKALLLGDAVVGAVIDNAGLSVKEDGRVEGLHDTIKRAQRTGAAGIKHGIWASEWALKQMNIKPTSKSRERLRAALLRLRKQ
jgi:hypothetical protein